MAKADGDKDMYEPIFKLERTGIQIDYHTAEERRYPAHWHSAIELIYILNGNAIMMVEGKKYPVISGEFILIDSNVIHEFRYARQSMMVVLHFSRNSMKNLMPDLNKYVFHCTRETIEKSQLEPYLRICDLLKKLPPLFFLQPTGYMVKGQSIAMEIFFELLNHFAEEKDSAQKTDKEDILERMGEIAEYINVHHAEAISLEDIASQFYLSREYFSRFFKKNMGVTFTQYLNQVRLMYIYQDICNTQAGVLESAESHGFTNYKLFSRMFREIYGCTPREARRDSNN